MSTINKTPNYAAHKFVDKREEFEGSSCYGQAYAKGTAPYIHRTWLSAFEELHLNKMRPRVTYIVWSFYTPIAYYVDRQGWYLVGQTFSSFTSRHRNGAMRNVKGHPMTLTGDKGDWTVTCLKRGCWGERHFTVRRDAEQVYYLHGH